MRYEARYSSLDLGKYMLLGIGLLCWTAAVKFMLVDHAWDVVPYPLSGGAIFVAVFALFTLRVGRLTLTDTTLSGGRRLGGAFSLSLDDITAIRYDADSAYASLSPGAKKPIAEVLITRRSGKPLALQRLSPAKAPGVLWFSITHRALLPPGANLAFEPGTTAPGLKEAHRDLAKDGKILYGDRGLLFTVEGVHVYLPTTGTVAPMGLGGAMALVAHVHISKLLHFGDAPNALSLPMRAFADALIRAPLPAAEKLRRAREVALRHGGQIFEAEPLSGPIGTYQATVRPAA